MAKSYNEYVTHFLGESAEKGFSYTLYKTLSVAPSALGHLIDTILALDGIFLVKDSHFVGPFGILLGFIPLILGYLLGHVIDFILKAPCYFGYYVFDVPLTWALHNTTSPIPFDDLVNESRILTPIKMYLTRFTNSPPQQMKGGFGFILGILPHIALYIVTRIASILTSLINVIVNNICEGISYLYSLDYDPVPPIPKKAALDQPYEPFPGYGGSFDFNGFNPSQPEPSAAPASAAYSQAGANVNPNPGPTEEGSGTTSKKGKRRARIQRPPEREEIDEQKEPDLFKVTESKLNLFAELRITKEDYVAEATQIAETNTAAAGDEEKTVSTESDLVKKAFRKISLQCHPDKVKGKGEELEGLAADKFARVNTAHKILLDTNSLQAKKYVYFYEQNEAALELPLSIESLINSAPATTSTPSPSELQRSVATARPPASSRERRVESNLVANNGEAFDASGSSAASEWRVPPESPVPHGAQRQGFLANGGRGKEIQGPVSPAAVASADLAIKPAPPSDQGGETVRSFRRKPKPKSSGGTDSGRASSSYVYAP